MSRRRTLPIRLFLGPALLASSLVAAPSAPASALDTRHLGARAHVDAALISQVAHGPTPALVAYDRRETSPSALASELEAAGIRALMFERVSVAVACASTAADLMSLSLTPGVRSIYANQELTPALDQSVKTAFNGNPKAVWESLGITGKGVGIAVIDTGLDATHPDLEFGRRTKQNVRVLFSHREALGPQNDACLPDTYTSTVADAVKDFTGQRPDDLQDTELTSGHGTHIASVAAGDGTASGGRYTGVAPEADLMGIAAFDTLNVSVGVDDPSTGREVMRPSTMGAIAGINYVLLNGLEETDVLVKVVLAGWTMRGELHDPWHPLAFAIRDLYDFGVNIVFPAGNQGPEVSDCSTAETCFYNPYAVGDFAIGVAATSPKTSRAALAPYSSRGDPQERPTVEGPVRYEPTIAAPGSSVLAARRPGVAPFVSPEDSMLGAHGNGSRVTLDPDYVPLTGTSVAAGHVAGAIALMQQAAVEAKGCFLRPGEVRQILEQTATPMNGYAAWEAGAGMLDVTQAVELARSWPSTPRPEPWICPN